MSVANPTFRQIRAQVAAIRKKLPQARTIGIRSIGQWTGESENRDGTDVYLIRQCNSPLAFRLALREPTDSLTTKVLLTSLDEGDLSDDIRIRLAKRSLFEIDAWQIVRTLFQAHAVDPRLTRHGWIAEFLLESVPREGYPAARAGFLDAETVWPLLLGQQLGLGAATPDLTALLRWSVTVDSHEVWKRQPDAFRQAATDWLTDTAGPVAGLLLSKMSTWNRAEAVPLGLAAGVLFHPGTNGRLEKALGKLEAGYLGNTSPPVSLMRSWSAAATEVVRAIRHTDAERARQLVTRADELLEEVGARDFAALSDTSPAGFDQRLAQFGLRLTDIVKRHAWSSTQLLAAAREAIRIHDHASRDYRRVERTEMALRILGWLASRKVNDADPRSFCDAATAHLVDGGFADWARLTLRAGDPVQELSEAYAQLFTAVTNHREREARRFASLFADWTATGSKGDDVLPVERILAEVVAPLAAARPVLVVVIDGMSVAVGRELLADLMNQEWLPIIEPNRPRNRPGIATLPSITEFSRTSLLCGRLQGGDAAIEKVGFAAHPALVKHCRAGHPPLLFHKAALQKADDAGLGKDVREAIQSSQRRIVGVVVNAVDDYLAKGEQLAVSWSQDKLHILPALLHEAKSAGRVVVLLSDHGHILDCQTVQRSPVGAGDVSGARWKPVGDSPEQDEFTVRGSRVLVAGQQLTAPWSERIRYGGKQNGYHGGLSPQEMVVPILVLSSTEKLPEGWQLQAVDLPLWWDQSLEEVSQVASPPPRLKTQTKFTPAGQLFPLDSEDQPALASAPGATTSGWIIQLLNSPIYLQLRALGHRGLPDNAKVEQFLQVLESRGGKMTEVALARALSLPELRLPGLLAQLSRLLNLDGYLVLSRDELSSTVELNRNLLLKQFDLVED